MIKNIVLDWYEVTMDQLDEDYSNGIISLSEYRRASFEVEKRFEEDVAKASKVNY